MQRILLIFCLLYSCFSLALYGRGSGERVFISYNVENLFDAVHDTLRNDSAFLPEGERHWTPTKYRRKQQQIAKVIAALGEWNQVALIGLQEVENSHCLDDLCHYALHSYGYRYIHHEGPDLRGVDVALLYDPRQVTILHDSAIHIPMPDGERPTRDLLFVQCRLSSVNDSLSMVNCIICHLPSQMGGREATQRKRDAAFSMIQSLVDSLLTADSTAAIIVMGDMNSEPQEYIHGLHNLMIPMAQAGLGTEQYQGIWSCLDQFFVSDALLPYVEAHIYDAPWLLEEDPRTQLPRPKRTFQGWNYQPDGFSDHLPIYLDLR